MTNDSINLQLKINEEYWTSKLNLEVPQWNFVQLQALDNANRGQLSFALDKAVLQQIKSRFAKSDLAFYTFALSALHVLFYRYSGNTELLVATPSFQPNDEEPTKANYFIASKIAEKSSFLDVLKQVKDEVIQAHKYRDIDSDYLLTLLEEEDKKTFYQLAFVYENFQQPLAEERRYGIEISLNENGNLSIDYNVDFVDAAFVLAMAGHYNAILKQVSTNLNLSIDELDYLLDAEKQELLQLTETASNYPKEKTLAALFEEQVLLHPNQIALSFRNEKLTYAQLNERANQVAHFLLQKGITPKTTVGMLLSRSNEMIITLLGILKAGGTYVPLDPEFPQERIDFILNDSATKLVLTQPEFEAKIPVTQEAIFIDSAEIIEASTENPVVDNKSSNPAYIIYTSGSTGTPKGTVIAQYSVTRVVRNTNYIEIKVEDRLLQLSTVAFDGSVFDTFGALLNGAHMVLIAKEDLLNLQELLATIREESISVMFITTALFNTLVDTDISALKKLRKILFGGERVSVPHVRKALDKLGSNVLVHVYGPTESTVFASYYPINHLPENALTVPIGKALANTEIYVLDKNLQLQAKGTCGELCISGDGLSLEYLNNPELTATSFVNHPHKEGQKLYKTGDLVKLLPDGNIEFVDRLDQQVKIRGFRIELGEIEHRLLQIEDLRECVVLTLTDEANNKFLCAYFTATEDLEARELKSFVAEKLPAYMVPEQCVQLTFMPLNANGKIDKKKLPYPTESDQNENMYVPAESDTEKRLVEIWQDLLGSERIGITDHFFELGGHSLKASVLLFRVQEEFGVKIPMGDFFAQPSIAPFATLIEKSPANHQLTISKAPADGYRGLDSYPLSPAQKRMLILNQFEGAGTSYNMPGFFEIEGKLDVEAFKNAFQKLVNRHESFRTRFAWIDGIPMQYIENQLEFKIEEKSCSEAEIDEQLSQFVREFDLSKAPLLRVRLLHIEAERFVFFFDMHHIISDGISMSILFREFLALYHGEELPELRLQYKDYAWWHQELVANGSMAENEKFWLETFIDNRSDASIPLDFKRPETRDFKGRALQFQFSETQLNGLKKLAQQEGTTLYMTLLAAYNVLLSKYSGETDIVVGSPASGRNHAALQDVIGMFVNTLAMRNFPEGHKTFSDFLQEVKRHTLEAFDHDNFQFEELVDLLRLQRDMSRNPLFDTMFALQNISFQQESVGDLQFRPLRHENQVAKFDLFIEAQENSKSLDFTVSYATSLFKEESINRLFGHFSQVIDSILENPATTLDSISLLSEAEMQEVVHAFNDNKTDYPADKTIAQLFEEQVAATPNAPALFFGETSYSYAELNAEANQLAALLRKKGVKSEEVVGIIAERNALSIIGILAIIKASGAYLPIDPNAPQERSLEMLQNAAVKIVLHQGELSAPFNPFDCINLTQKPASSEAATNMELATTPNSLAYILFTSGSTGQPKGVLIEQQAVVRLVKNTNYLQIVPSDRIFLTGALTFDATTFEIWGALLNGARLYVSSQEELLNTKTLGNLLKYNGINRLWITVNFFNQLVETDLQLFAPLQTLLVGGDRLSPYHVEKLRKAHPHIQVNNLYGPTENTTFTTYFPIENELSGEIPIGKPISNTSVYVLDSKQNPLPIGLPGEIYIGGAGLSRGYLNDEVLSAEKFVVLPETSPIPDKRLYKTGDLGKWDENGDLHFLGRNDSQVKLRGFRIELGEIENRLLEHEAISESCVLLIKDVNENQYLAAYYASQTEIEVTVLRDFLAEKLPDYMIPTAFMQLEQLPLNKNGKIDKKALPSPVLDNAITADYQAPESETEIALSEIWQEILGINTPGIHSNFFELGGHSLRAMQVLAQIESKLSAAIGLTEFFKNPTIAGLSKIIDGKSKKAVSEIITAPAQEYYPLSAQQNRMYILHALEEQGTTYNMPFFLRIQGNLDLDKLKNTFQELVNRHESLRTSFHLIDGEVKQKIHANCQFDIAVYEQKADISDQFVSAFDLQEAPLIRVSVVKESENSHLLLTDMHHIISDGNSIQELLQEFLALYEGQTLTEIKLQYKDYAYWQHSGDYQSSFAEKEKFWLKQFGGNGKNLPVLQLPYDFPRPAIQRFEGDRVIFSLNKKQSSAMQQLAHEQDSTLFMVLLATYTTLLAKYSGQDEIIVGTPVSGRSHAAIQHTIGMFVNTLALRSYPEADKPFQDYLRELTQNSLQAFDNQDYPFEELVEKLQVPRDLSRNPLFDTMFTLQHKKGSGSYQESYSGNLSMEAIQSEGIHAKFDLFLEAFEGSDEITLSLTYSTNLFKQGTIERLAKHFAQLSEQLLVNPQAKLGDLSFLSSEERTELLRNAQAEQLIYPKEQNIATLIEQNVQEIPQQTALYFEDQKFSYADVNSEANRIAHALLEAGVQENETVALLVNRSPEMLFSMLGVLKAGAAYVPVDPAYPAERINYMLEDCQAKVLLTNQSGTIEFKGKIIALSDVQQQKLSSENPKIERKAESLAYIIYTSGSTGFPKGVALTHRNAVSFIYWCKQEFQNTPFEVVFAGTSYSFDLSIFELFYSLAAGKQIRLLSSGLAIADYLNHHQAVLINTVPTVMKDLLEREVDLGNVAAINMAGEPIPSSIKEKLDYKRSEVRNLYGPSEDTTYSTCYRLQNADERQLIGKAIANTQTYIVDAHLQLLPNGIAGELCLSGDGLAQGYLHREELTAEKFITNPFQTGTNPHQTGTKLYRTGDLVRLLEDGNLEYLGRIDQQVKIRGFRIELGEIESRLLAMEKITEAVVVSRKALDGSAYLCAYFAASNTLEISQLREKLGRHLPDYMVPASFMQLETLPLTPNGKVDKKALPEAEIQSELRRAYEAPENETQRELIGVWEDLLNVENIGIGDHFFELGGQSLKATRLISSIHKKFGVQFPLSAVFKNPVLKELAAVIVTAEKQDFQHIRKAAKKDYYPLSSAQKRLYILNQMEGPNTSYNMPGAVRWKGQLNQNQVQQVLDQLIMRHESLRTSFELIDNEPVQRIWTNPEFEVQFKTISADNIQAELAAFIQPFDLEKAPLLRVACCEISAGDYALFFDMHHVISDGASMKLLLSEFSQLMQGKPLTPLNIQYTDYASWQQEQFSSGNFASQRQFWLKQLSETESGKEIPVLDLPTDFTRPVIRQFEGGEIAFSLPKELTQATEKLSLQEGLTLQMILLGAFQILLSKYSRQEDILVATPVEGRPHADLQALVGMFVNTLVYRGFPEASKTGIQYLQEVKENALAAYENQDYPFDELISDLNLERQTGRNPLFDVMFVYQENEQTQTGIEARSLEALAVKNTVSKFDLTLKVAHSKENLAFSIEYASSLFLPETIKRMGAHFQQLLQLLVASPEKKLGQLEMLTNEEKEAIQKQSKGETRENRLAPTITASFQEIVNRFPAKVAIQHKENKLTYSELNNRIELLASTLFHKGLCAEEAVAVLLNRSEKTLIAMLAVMRAGGAYLPIDPEAPAERIRFMLEDSGAKIVLVDHETAATGIGKLTPLNLDEITEIQQINLPIILPDKLAYIIYTSGSIGLPKGVKVEHGSFMNMIETQIDSFEVMENDRCLQFASPAFDASLYESLMALLSGASLHVFDKEIIRESEVFKAELAKQQISIATLPPVYLSSLNQSELPSLRVLITAGEAANPADVAFYASKLDYYNAYGPTETSVCATLYKVNPQNIGTVAVPIGMALPNTSVYALDEQFNLLPIGVPGEICVSGAGLARGYLNRPELTAEKFIHTEIAGPLYRTGDLAKRLPDGNLIFLGRIDEQVKIRGHRIELGEIEYHLSQIPDIREAVVVAHKDGSNPYLAAYLVAGKTIEAHDIKAYLAAFLPDYMLPTYFVQLESIPLTSNGKVDKKALPEPKTLLQSGTTYVAPRNETERILCEIWQKTLGLERIGIHDDFFVSGGDSIKAIQIASRLLPFGLKLEVKNLFRYPTIAQLSSLVQGITLTVNQGPISGLMPLTPIQHWFVEQQFSAAHHWNQSLQFFFKGQLDEILVKKAVLALVEHHDALRLRLEKNNQAYISPWTPDYPLAFSRFDFSEHKDVAAAISKQAQEIQAGLDLKNKLLEVALFHTQEGDHLLFAVHHFLTDGVSWRILIEDLNRAYTQLESGKAVSLPGKTHSYLNWAEKLQAYAEQNKAKKELTYWKHIAAQKVAQLPVKTQERKSNAGSQTLVLKLDPENTELLLKKANQAYHTSIDDLLLTALALSVKQWTNNGQSLIQLEGHGREDIFSDLDITRTVGWFTSIYPVLLDLPKQDDLSRQIRSVKENLRNIPNKGVGYGILKYLTDEETKAALHCSPQISFNYLGQFDQDVQQESKWGISGINSGDAVSLKNERTAALEINSMVSGGSLRLNFGFHPEQLDEADLKQFLQHFESHLLAIIEHCSSIEKSISTPSDYPNAQLSIEELTFIEQEAGSEIESIYTLAPMQLNMLYQAELDKDSHSYFQQTSFSINSQLDVAVVEQSFQFLLDRYSILRSNFILEGLNVPHQFVHLHREAQLDFEDLSGMDKPEADKYIADFKEQDKKRGFDLQNAPLIRMSLYQTSALSYHICWSFHHILMDGWCLGIVMKDFFAAYQAYSKGISPDLAPVEDYESYISWLNKQETSESIDYWRNYLLGYEQSAIIPGKRKEKQNAAYQLGVQELRFSASEFEEVKQWTVAQKVTVNDFFQSVWGILLQNYNQTNDVVFGSVISGRPAEIPGIEEMVGLFINTIPVRVQSTETSSFENIVQNVHDLAVQTMTHGHLPLAEIQNQSDLKQGLLNHVLIFENFPLDENLTQADENPAEKRITDVAIFEQTNYDFNVSVIPANDLCVRFSYNEQLYGSETIATIAEQLRTLLLNCLRNPKHLAKKISLISETEKQQILHKFNDTAHPLPSATSIMQLFEEQVLRTPKKTALWFHDQVFTFAELNAQANQLAHYLLESKIQANDIIGIQLHRSPEMIISILGILKAGAAYLPIDPAYPQERIDFMLSDSGAKLVVDEAFLSRFLTVRNTYNTENTRVLTKTSDLAYVIYTSGSTGKPKGVQLQQGNVLSFQQNLPVHFGIGENDRILGVTTTTFDISVLELLCSLLNGCGIVLADEAQIEDLYQLGALLQEKQVTAVQTTPSRLQVLIEACGLEVLAGLKTILVGGEALPYTLAERLKTLEKTNIYNVYGPTEACIWSSFSDVKQNGISIGKPLLNEQIVILSPEMDLQGIGIPGELCIAGAGVAKGYVNRPELNDSVFVKMPKELDSWIPSAGQKKLYKTGDLATWMPDGTLNYIGRVDHQVKIRGYRIELGEIEFRLGMHPDVKESVVSAFTEKNGNQALCAYYTLQNTATIAELRQFLQSNLPEYMVPTYWMELETMPLMSNGKVNRKSLPEPGSQQTAIEYVAPTTDLQQDLAAIWKEVLLQNEDKLIGIKESFFDLGGHSLKATQLVSRVRKLGYPQLNLRLFFENPTIENLAAFLEMGSTQVYKGIEKVAEQDFYPLSPTQQTFWLNHKLADGHDGYVLFGAVKIHELLEPALVNAIFQELIKRHESLRTQFTEKNGEAVQQVLKQIPFEVEVIDLSQDESAQERLEAYIDLEPQLPFDLKQAPLLRVKLIQLPGSETALLFAAHHIIGDGWSMDLLVQEFSASYIAHKKQKEITFPEQVYTYKDFAVWENKHFSGAGKATLETFWAKHLLEEIQGVVLPYDYPKSQGKMRPGAEFNLQLDGMLQQAVYAFIRQHKLTLNSFFLSAFNVFLSKISRQDEIVLRTISTGRKWQEFETVIGAFVRPFALKNFPDKDKNFIHFAQEVQQRFLEAEENSAYPMEILLEKYDNLNSGINVSFAMQNLQTIQKAQLDASSLSLRNLRPQSQQAQNDLLLQVNDAGDSFQCLFNYRSDLFEESKIALFGQWFNQLLKQLLSASDESFANIHLSDGTEDALFDYLQQDKAEIQAIYPLTTVQRDLYLDSIIHPEEKAHNLSYFLRINSELNAEMWNKAVQKVVDSTPILRATMMVHHQEIYQKIARQTLVKTEIKSFNQTDFSIEKLENWIEEVVNAPYDFSSGSLFRNFIVQVSPTETYVVFGVHHSIFDGWSYKVFYEKVAQVYQLLINGENVILEEDNYFTTYIPQHLTQFDTGKVLAYWKRKLNGVEALSVSKSHLGEKQAISKKLLLPASKWEVIQNYCKENNLSTPLYFKSLYAFLLKSYAYAKSDFVINELTGTRNGENALESIGCLYHSLPQRFSPEMMGKDVRISDYLLHVKNQKKELGERQFLSVFAKNKFLNEENTVFYFNYQTYFNQQILGEKTQMLGFVKHGEKQIQLILREWKEDLELVLDYHSNYFEDFDFLEGLLYLSDQIIGGATFMHELQLCEQAGISESSVAFPRSATIHGIIEEQAAKFPENIAVSFEHKLLTYAELNALANQLAHYLSEQQQIMLDDRIALMLDRSEYQVVAILAVLKTGACYVPIDPSYPQERIDYLLADSGAKLVIDEDLVSRFLTAVPDGRQVKNLYATEFTGVPVKPSHLAYIIYTSGTTGLPKGTMIEHQNVVRLLVNDAFQFSFSEKDVWTMFHSFSFDFSVWEIFGALFFGGKLVIVPKETAQQSVNFLQLLKKEQVTVLNQIPNLFSNLMHAELEQENAGLKLRYVIFGGDMLKPAILKDWYKRYPQTKLINMYGITETTVHVTYKEITESEINSGISNIGTAIPTLECLIMDENLKRLPVGIPGEIIVAGAGVARGYLNKPELTATKFVTLSQGNQEVKIYRSGDLGRLLPNGDLEYLGRIDQQVKIRGFRIELGEIENSLQKHQAIRLSTVLAKEIEKGSKDLVAYYESDAELNVLELREFLSGFLPDYMIPGYFVQLTKFPITTNGKIDRNALPDPKERVRSGSEYVEPESETEKALCSMWSTLLDIPHNSSGKPGIGTVDNFFALGGHSLKIIQLISQIQQLWEIELPVKVVFENPTIQAIAYYIDTAIRLDMKSVDEVGSLLNETGKSPLFFFPSGGGYGLTYKELAAKIDSHSFYGLNFVEAENRMEQYIAYLKEIQAEGPFVLGGYSAGGNLAFRVARELEKRGEKVACLLFFDVPYRDEVAPYTPDEVKSRAKTLIYGPEGNAMGNILQNDYLRGKIESKVEGYLRFLYSGTDEGKITAPIYLIQSEEIVPEPIRDRRKEWKKATNQKLTILNGSGEHGNMLLGKQLETNAEMLNDLLRKLE